VADFHFVQHTHRHAKLWVAAEELHAAALGTVISTRRAAYGDVHAAAPAPAPVENTRSGGIHVPKAVETE
jgi:hypothetical protein